MNIDMMMLALMMKEKTMVMMKMMTNEKFHLNHNRGMIKQESSWKLSVRMLRLMLR